MAADGRRVCVGVITGAHGVRGAVRVKSFTADPEDVARYGPLEDESGERRLSLRVIGTAKGVLLAAHRGVADRDRAERLRGLRLYLPRAALPPPADEEYLPRRSDRPRSRARRRHARSGRSARSTISAPATRSRSSATRRRRCWCPFTRAAVPVVDIAAGRLVIDPPAGLFDPSGRRPRRRRVRGSDRHELARDRADDLPGDVSGAARLFARRQGADGGHLAARNGRHPRFRARQAPLRRRRAVRRRAGHGDAARCARRGDRRRRRRRAADLSVAARPAARPGAGRGAGGGAGRAAALRPVRGRSTSACSRRARSRR